MESLFASPCLSSRALESLRQGETSSSQQEALLKGGRLAYWTGPHFMCCKLARKYLGEDVIEATDNLAQTCFLFEASYWRRWLADIGQIRNVER